MEVSHGTSHFGSANARDHSIGLPNYKLEEAKRLTHLAAKQCNARHAEMVPGLRLRSELTIPAKTDSGNPDTSSSEIN